jgi:hypothetical protein
MARLIANLRQRMRRATRPWETGHTSELERIRALGAAARASAAEEPVDRAWEPEVVEEGPEGEPVEDEWAVADEEEREPEAVEEDEGEPASVTEPEGDAEWWVWEPEPGAGPEWKAEEEEEPEPVAAAEAEWEPAAVSESWETEVEGEAPGFEEPAWEPEADGEQREIATESERIATVSEPQLGEGRVSLRSASFEDLRAVGMSVTQAKRVLQYRDERGLDSVADLHRVPGLSKGFLAYLRGRLTN